MPWPETELTDADRVARIGHALQLTPRRRATSQRKPRSSARRAPRWATREYELGELGALGGLAVDAILRHDGKRGAAVAPPRDVSAAPAELPVTLVRPAGDTISGT